MTSDEFIDSCIAAALDSVRESSPPGGAAAVSGAAGPIPVQLSPQVVAALAGVTQVALAEQERLLHLMDEAIEMLRLPPDECARADVTERIVALRKSM
jgi:hypothetical protein